MTTRHTITHADELYAGNAYNDGDSPDGRRGVPMPHIYVREYGAIVTKDHDGLFASVLATKTGNLVLLCTGAWASIVSGGPDSDITNSASSGTIVLDTPRNICWKDDKDSSALTLLVKGKDEYENVMWEKISGPSNTTVHGVKAFKKINSMTITGNSASLVCIGFSNKIGLPYHLKSKGKFLGLAIDGFQGTTGVTQPFALVSGQALATDATSTYGDPDVRGTVNVTQANYVPNGTKEWTAMMIVDHSTRDKAYGNVQATA